MNGLAEGLFIDLRTPVIQNVNAALNYVVETHGNGLRTLANGLLQSLVLVERALLALPPIVAISLMALAVFALSRRLSLAAVTALSLWVIGSFGLWTEAMQTLALTLTAVLLTIMCGVPLGIACAKRQRLRTAVLPLLDVMQTIPSFIYLLPAAMLFGLGKVPALLATCVYALPPLVRLTDLGLRGVERGVLEAARACGLTPPQSLYLVELPLARPSIMQGVNQTVMAALSMVVVASMIGARGLGETVLLGLQRNDAGLGLIGGMAIVALAILIDRTLQAHNRGAKGGPHAQGGFKERD